MRKSTLSNRQMYVDQAVIWSKELTRMKARGPGDLENAMRAVERDYGIDYWTIWQLRYRSSRLKDVGVSIYMRLQAAYQAECERQRQKLVVEIERTKAIAGPDCPAVVAAEIVAGEGQSEAL